MAKPSQNGGNGGKGRDAHGRFVKGNQAAVGHSGGICGKVHGLRTALLAAVSTGDVQRIAKRLVTQAENGNIQAARLLFAYVLGRPIEHDVFERIEALEELADGFDAERTNAWPGDKPSGG